MTPKKLNLALADASLAKKLREIHDLEKTDGPLCYRGETSWQLDALEEDDDKARATFELAGLNPTNPHHRDLMLDILIDHLPFSGRPSWNSSDFFALLKDVVEKRSQLGCSVMAACAKLAKDKKRNPLGAARFYPGRYSATTLKDRYYEAIRYFEGRLHTDRFDDDWPVLVQEELKALLDRA
jgi:hypothetical protein